MPLAKLEVDMSERENIGFNATHFRELAIEQLTFNKTFLTQIYWIIIL